MPQQSMPVAHGATIRSDDHNSLVQDVAELYTAEMSNPTAIARDTSGRITAINGLAITRGNGLVTGFGAVTLTWKNGRIQSVT